MFVLLVTALTVASKVANWCHVMSVNVVVMVASLFHWLLLIVNVHQVEQWTNDLTLIKTDLNASP